MLPDSLENISLLMRLDSKEAIIAYESITPGLSSMLWKITTTNGVFVLKKSLAKLRVKDDWYISTRRNKNEYKYLKELRNYGCEYVPKVFVYENKKNYFIMEYIESFYPNWKSKLAHGQVDPEDSYNAGKALGVLHTTFLKLPHLFERFNDKDLFFQTRLSPYWLALLPKYPDLKKHIYHVIQSSLKNQITIIHGDASPKNFLILKNRIVLLDAECAFYGDPAYDLAFLLSHIFLKTYMGLPSNFCLNLMVRQTITAYLPYITWENMKGFFDRLRLYLLMLILARVDGKASVEYVSEADKEAIRFFVKSQLSKNLTALSSHTARISLNKSWCEAFNFIREIDER